MIHLQMLLFYITWILFIFIISVGWSNYYYFGELSLNLYIVTLLVKTYPFTTIAIIIVLILIIFYQYKMYKENRRNCQITYVDLEKIAHLWLELEEIEDNIETKVMSKMEVSFDESKKDIQDVLNTLIGSKDIQDFTFYRQYIFNYLDAFSKQELEIISSLYELLETKAKVLPSVATLFKNDTDRMIYKDTVSETLTSYEILYKVTLFDHTMNVVRNMYDILIKEKDSFVFTWSRMLIASMAHDIGKIEKIESLQGLSSLDKGKYEHNTHENISRIILSNAYPSFEYIDDVCEIIEKHHIQSLDEKNKNYTFIKHLQNADHLARKQEIKEYLNSKKNKILNDNGTEDIKQTKDIVEEELLTIETFQEENIPQKQLTLFDGKSNNVINPDAEVYFSPSNIADFIELLIKIINEVEFTSTTKRVKLLSLSNKDELFVPREIFIKLSKKAGLKAELVNEVNALIKKLKSDGVLKREASNIFLENFFNPAYRTIREYLVFDLNSLNINIEDVELKKRNGEYLRNVIIRKGGGNE